MAVYMIMYIKRVLDTHMLGPYLAEAQKTMLKFGGKYMTRGGCDVVPISGDWHPKRIVIVEFESMKKLNAWLKSPEFKADETLRRKLIEVNAVAVEDF